MTTTVKVTAHNNPCVVTINTDHGNGGKTRSVFILKDGDERDFTVTSSQSVRVFEPKPKTQNP